MNGRQSSVSGIFELKIGPRRVREGSQLIQLAGSPSYLAPSCWNRSVVAFQVAARLGGFGDNPSSKDLTGTAKTTADEKETKLDAVSHATLK
jgi:hypothetical protein